MKSSLFCATSSARPYPSNASHIEMMGKLIIGANFTLDWDVITLLSAPSSFSPCSFLTAQSAVRNEHGALSTTTRRKFGWISKENKKAPKNVGIVDDEDSQFQKVKKKNWARLIAKVWLDDL